MPTIVVSNPTIVKQGSSLTYNRGSIISVVAGSGGIAAYHVCYLYTDGKVRTASNNTISHAGRVIGFATDAILADAAGNITINGLITNPAWVLIPGNIYYLGIGGEITSTIPTSGFIQKIGIAKSATSLVIDLGEPIILV